MNKKLIQLILALIFHFSVRAQEYTGKWEGIYISSDTAFWDTIWLTFQGNADDTYTIKSFSKGKNIKGADSIIVCRVGYKIISPDSIVLYETQILEPGRIKYDICLQTMTLKYYKSHRRIELAGEWYCTKNKEVHGFVRFRKISYKL